eukprot:12616331-Ditylum_brightwellii.AAC.1
MLWSVRHTWVTGSQFAFNAYRHWQKLVLQGHKDLVMSKEDVTQGDLLTMILYALAVLPIILNLERFMTEMDITEAQLQKWFADDSAIGAFFQSIKEWYGELCVIGPPLVHHPDSDKSILVTHLKSFLTAKGFFIDYGFKMKEGHCYLGGYIISSALQETYVSEKVHEWVASVGIFTEMMPHQPQITILCWEKTNFGYGAAPIQVDSQGPAGLLQQVWRKAQFVACAAM